MIEGLDYLRIQVLMENTAPFGGTLLGQHGLSFLIEGSRDDFTMQVIMDVGQNHAALYNNMEKLNVDPCQIDAIVLSHCHYDHTGGIAALLAKIKKQDLPVIAHPDIFRNHFLIKPGLRYLGMQNDDSADAIAASGGRLLLTNAQLPLMPGLMTTGEVPRVTLFEEGGLEAYTIKEGCVQKDKIRDDLSLAACVRGKGIVVMTGCSHAGIINTIKQAFSLFPGEKLYAVIGGMHLTGAAAERINCTVEELFNCNPTLVAAGHCTGFKAQVALSNALGDRFVPLNAGAEFVIRA